MVKDGILKEVSEPTDWVHPIVITKKPNGKVRICIDPRTLIKYILWCTRLWLLLLAIVHYLLD